MRPDKGPLGQFYLPLGGIFVKLILGGIGMALVIYVLRRVYFPPNSPLILIPCMLLFILGLRLEFSV
jgi:hypothetical protein